VLQFGSFLLGSGSFPSLKYTSDGCLTLVVAFQREDFERDEQARVTLRRSDEPLARAVDEVLVRIVGRVHVSRHAARYVPETTCDKIRTQSVHHQIQSAYRSEFVLVTALCKS